MIERTVKFATANVSKNRSEKIEANLQGLHFSANVGNKQECGLRGNLRVRKGKGEKGGYSGIKNGFL